MMQFCNKCGIFTEHNIEFDTISGRRYTIRTCNEYGEQVIQPVSR